MEFVVHVLMKFFLWRNGATQIMLHVITRDTHRRAVFTGRRNQASQVMDYAKEHGHPLKCTAEPEGFAGSDQE
jgi:ATP-dependent Clp protease adaptor protein ClpS